MIARGRAAPRHTGLARAQLHRRKDNAYRRYLIFAGHFLGMPTAGRCLRHEIGARDADGRRADRRVLPNIKCLYRRRRAHALRARDDTDDISPTLA